MQDSTHQNLEIGLALIQSWSRIGANRTCGRVEHWCNKKMKMIMNLDSLQLTTTTYIWCNWDRLIGTISKSEVGNWDI